MAIEAFCNWLVRAMLPLADDLPLQDALHWTPVHRVGAVHVHENCRFSSVSMLRMTGGLWMTCCGRMLGSDDR